MVLALQTWSGIIHRVLLFFAPDHMPEMFKTFFLSGLVFFACSPRLRVWVDDVFS